jgi:hypothetical protein
VAYIRELNKDERTKGLPVKDKIEMMKSGLPINYVLMDEPQEVVEQETEKDDDAKQTPLNSIRSSINMLSKSINSLRKSTKVFIGFQGKFLILASYHSNLFRNRID